MFPQEQRITCLILKAYLNETFREIVDLLQVADAPYSGAALLDT